METYDWAWVEARVDETARIWLEPEGAAEGARTYSLEEREIHERAYDETLNDVEQALRPPAGAAEERIVASFGRFSANALGLDRESTELLTEGFLPVGTGLAKWARRFDPELSMEGIIQAARNAWTACGLQPLLGVPLALTPSILGYSLIYPYSDNLLDDETIPGDAKLRFSGRLRRRLLGETLTAEDHRERCVWALVELVETQYPRAAYAGVYECLLAIQEAQERSVGQVQDSPAEGDCLRISCAKGGSSVLADACLAYGSMTRQESRFAFEWGVLLQLGDDLQDVREDLRHGSMTLFSRVAAGGRPLDEVTIRLLQFAGHVGRRMARLAGGTDAYKNMLTMSWRSLIVAAVADSHEYFSVAFLREAERYSPFRFAFLRERKKRLKSRQGLYATLFGALLESGQDNFALPDAAVVLEGRR